MRILLIGGGKSGKSTMAQRLAAALSGDAPRYYWATMTPHDDEDLARIHRHVADRAGMALHRTPTQQSGYCGSCWISAVTPPTSSPCATISGTAARTTGTGRKFMFGAWRISVKGWQRNLTWYVR